MLFADDLLHHHLISDICFEDFENNIGYHNIPQAVNENASLCSFPGFQIDSIAKVPYRQVAKTGKLSIF